MRPPLTKVLIKIFAYGFYRAHAGLLLFLSATVLLYAVFVPVLNQTHLTPAEIIAYNLSLARAFSSTPVVTALVFAVWLGYTVKSGQYVVKQLKAADQQFLFYSSTALAKAAQFRSWWVVQFIILLPLAGYGLFAGIVGLGYDYYLIPAITLFYLALLTAGSAFWYVQVMNRLTDEDRPSYLLILTRRWRKPFFSLFLYHVLDQLKLPYALTKVLSWLLITGIFYFFSDVPPDVRVAGLVVLAVTTAHAFLIYQAHCFQERYLRFARNLPYRRSSLFLGFSGVFLLLVLPEVMGLFIWFDLATAVGLLLFGGSTALLFHSFLYGFGSNMRPYLRGVSGLFFLFLLIILFDLLWWLIPLNLLVAFMLFYRSYYRYEAAA